MVHSRLMTQLWVKNSEDREGRHTELTTVLLLTPRCLGSGQCLLAASGTHLKSVLLNKLKKKSLKRKLAFHVSSLSSVTVDTGLCPWWLWTQAFHLAISQVRSPVLGDALCGCFVSVSLGRLPTLVSKIPNDEIESSRQCYTDSSSPSFSLLSPLPCFTYFS